MSQLRIRVEQFEKQLQAAYQTSRWHSLKEALKDVKSDEARWQPAHYKGFSWAHGSILEIAFHVAGDTLYQLDSAFGSRALAWEALEARFKRDGGDLPAAIRLFEEGFSQLQGHLKGLTDADLERSYIAPDGKTQKTLEELFQMILEHWLYHAGQIVYVRSLWAGLKGQSESG